MLFQTKERWMIVGLGNPGKKYENTRHNAGFMALDRIEQAFGAPAERQLSNAWVAKAAFEGRELFFVRPLTFMNLSGAAVEAVGRYYKIPRENLLVIADDISMDLGRLRIRDKGSDGGHNGLKDIIRVLGSDAFLRIKIGVGQKPRSDYDLADWVLSSFSKEDRALLDPVLDTVPQAAAALIRREVEKAQNQWNR